MRNLRFSALAVSFGALCLVALSGCSTGTAPAEDATGASPAPSAEMTGGKAPSGAPMPGAGAPTMGGGPMAGGPMMGGGDPYAALSPSPELDKKIAEAEASKDKKKIADAYVERGTARLYDEKSGARVKYRAAISDYRKALAADPTDAAAKKGKTEIESIYMSMGRPIPSVEEADAVSKTGKYTPKPGEGGPMMGGGAPGPGAR